MRLYTRKLITSVHIEALPFTLDTTSESLSPACGSVQDVYDVTTDTRDLIRARGSTGVATSNHYVNTSIPDASGVTSLASRTRSNHTKIANYKSGVISQASNMHTSYLRRQAHATQTSMIFHASSLANVHSFRG